MKKILLGLYWSFNILAVTAMLIAALFVGRVYDRSLRLLRIDMQTLFVDNKISFTIIILCIFVFGITIFKIVKFSQNGGKIYWKVRILKWEKIIYLRPYKINGVFLFISFVWLLLCSYIYFYGKVDYEMSNWSRDITVGHSFGGINDDTYTGSLEAFEENYMKGHRTFEVDLILTSDKEIVLCHDWKMYNYSEETPPTLEEFLSNPIKGKYTPMSFEDLCVLMDRYDDIWIVLDTKDKNKEKVLEKFQILIDTVNRNNMSHILNRIIVQLYNEDMYDVVNTVYPFEQYIFTLYQRWGGGKEDFIQICRWSVKNNVDIITMAYTVANKDIIKIANRYGIDVYVHTLNDVNEAQKYIDIGVKGIYTDYIIPEELKGE